MPATRTRRVAPSGPAAATGFALVGGHGRVIEMLKAHRRSGRLSHAYCFTGEEGIGKATLARALAEELLPGDGRPARLEVHPDYWEDDPSEGIRIDELWVHT